MISTIIRILLSLALVVMVYRETGIWTSLCIFLIFVNAEAQAIISRRNNLDLRISKILEQANNLRR